MASELLRRGERRGLEFLLEIVESDGPLMTKQQAIKTLRESTGKNFGYDVLGDRGANQKALDQWKEFVD